MTALDARAQAVPQPDGRHGLDYIPVSAVRLRLRQLVAAGMAEHSRANGMRSQWRAVSS